MTYFILKRIIKNQEWCEGDNCLAWRIWYIVQ